VNQAPGFAGSSRIAAGKEAVSREDRRGLYYGMNHLIGRMDINLVRKKRRNKRCFIYSLLESLPQRCDEWLPGVASHGCGMSLLAKHFFEWTERRASEAPAGLPKARRRSAEKTGAGLFQIKL
jgi:hypothetical protein